jgi:hypothetical protein
VSTADYVAKFGDDDADYMAAGGTKITLAKDYRVGMACHNATFIWLYRAKHDGAFPTLEQMEDGATQAFVDKLIQRGHPTRVTSRSGPIAGDVLIFANPGTSTVGRHSCVVIAGGRTIAGYNQTGWFPGGLSHEYSTHDVDDIDWVARSCCFTPRRAEAAGAQRYIWAVRDAAALDAML